MALVRVHTSHLQNLGLGCGLGSCPCSLGSCPHEPFAKFAALARVHTNHLQTFGLGSCPHEPFAKFVALVRVHTSHLQNSVALVRVHTNHSALARVHEPLAKLNTQPQPWFVSTRAIRKIRGLGSCLQYGSWRHEPLAKLVALVRVHTNHLQNRVLGSCPHEPFAKFVALVRVHTNH